jgi:hypothetical protein
VDIRRYRHVFGRISAARPVARCTDHYLDVQGIHGLHQDRIVAVLQAGADDQPLFRERERPPEVRVCLPWHERKLIGGNAQLGHGDLVLAASMEGDPVDMAVGLEPPKERALLGGRDAMADGDVWHRHPRRLEHHGQGDADVLAIRQHHVVLVAPLEGKPGLGHADPTGLLDHPGDG